MKKILLAVWILLACNLAELSQFVPVTPTPTATATETEAVVMAVMPALLSPTTTPTSAVRRGRVCTGYPEGALNVRACPGTECWVVFVLAEGQEVAMDGHQTAQTEDGANWVYITQPAEGWVNARYICQEHGNGSR